jgi:hypothetical protein
MRRKFRAHALRRGERLTLAAVPGESFPQTLLLFSLLATLCDFWTWCVQVWGRREEVSRHQGNINHPCFILPCFILLSFR